MLDRVRASLAALTPAEQRVGQLVIKDPRKFAAMSIGLISEVCFVSKPTVVRFCRSLGYDGLTDFKQKLGCLIDEGVPFIHASVDVGDSTADVLVKVVDSTVAAFLRYRNTASSPALDRAVAALEDAYRQRRAVDFYGVGNSGLVAQDAQQKFFRLGVNAIAHSDGHMQVMSATLRQPGDVVIAVSNSGRTRDLIDAADIARKQGATVIAVTASGSPLAGIGNIHIAADHREDCDRFSSMTARLLHLTIVDVLATTLALRIGGEQLQDQLKHMQSRLQIRRYA